MDFDRFQEAFNKTKNLHIVMVSLQDTGTYNQQHLRPYVSHVEDSLMNVVVDRFAANVGKNTVAPGEIADIAGRMLTPQAQPEAQAIIPNSWGSVRMRFVVQAQAEYVSGGKVNYFVFGYTDHLGVSTMSMQPSIDPNMRFYVNSVISTREGFQMVGGHRQSVWIPNASDHIHGGPHAMNDYQMPMPGQHQFLMRPADIYNVNEVPHALQEAQMSGSNIYDSRNTLTGGAMASHRENSLASNFAARVIQAQLQAIPLSANSSNKSDMFATAAGLVRENAVYANAFLKSLSAERGDSRITNEFTFGDMMALDPGTYARTKYAPATGGLSQVHHAGMTADWGGTDLATTTANTIAHAMPAVMMSMGLTMVTMHSTNMTFGGQMATVATHGLSITQHDNIQPLLQALEVRLNTELFQAITFNNELSYSLHATVDVFGETWIKLQIGDSPEIDFVVPSFCDSLFAPTITHNKKRVQEIAHDFGYMVEGVKNTLGYATDDSFRQPSW